MKLTIETQDTQKVTSDGEQLHSVSMVVQDGIACAYERTKQVTEAEICQAIVDCVITYEAIAGLDIIPMDTEIKLMASDIDADDNFEILQIEQKP